MGSPEEHRLLEDGVSKSGNKGPHTGDGSVDIDGNPVLKEGTGNWKACTFILGNECYERLAYYGISTNLVTYLTKKLHQGNVNAARNVSTWAGTCYITPLIGVVLANAYWGRYWTIAIFFTIYFIGMTTLTLSASIPTFRPPSCVRGIKSCVSSFGADQFDDVDPFERAKKGYVFNWYYFSISVGALISSSLLVYIQDNYGWGLGFGIPTLFMGLAVVFFFSGTKLYRFQIPGGSPVTLREYAKLLSLLFASGM